MVMADPSDLGHGKNIARIAKAAPRTSHRLSRCHYNYYWSFVTIRVESQFEFLSYLTIWAFDFCHNLSFWVSSQFELLSFVTTLVFELSQFEFLIFVTIWDVEFCHKFFDFGQNLIFEFCHNSSLWVLSQFVFLSCH